MLKKKVTILIVDDSDIIRYLLKNFFNIYNFEVVTCIDGLEGVQKAQEHIPDLIFLDLMMPNFDGIKMLKVLKSIDDLKNIPVIVISGITSKVNVLNAISAGADRVISKPFKKEIIINAIEKLLGENFLKKFQYMDEAEKKEKEFHEELCKIFISEFPAKRRKILKAVENEDKTILAGVIHEMKGSSGSMGHLEISGICKLIEFSLIKPVINWDEVKIKCKLFFSAVENIEGPKSIEK